MSILKDYNDLVKFVNDLPGSATSSSMAFRRAVQYDPIEESILEAEELIYMFGKYRISQEDRKRLVSSIINMYLYNAERKANAGDRVFKHVKTDGRRRAQDNGNKRNRVHTRRRKDGPIGKLL